MAQRAARTAALGALLWAAIACSASTENLVNDPPRAGRDAAVRDAAVSGNGDATATGTAMDAGSTLKTNGQGHVLCGPKLCACDDGQDNDGDGLIDGLDPECTGPYDDDETSFATGKSKAGDNMTCLDCFFDGNASAQDDDCRYNSACLDGKAPGAAGGPTCSSCQVSTMCVDTCQRQTPNGCDCFGCCEVKQQSAGSLFVRLTDTCSLNKLGDKKACPRCTPSTQCKNDCGPCELCLGLTLADLGPECTPDGGTKSASCDNHEPRCDAQTPCRLDYYCHLGCCLPTVL